MDIAKKIAETEIIVAEIIEKWPIGRPEAFSMKYLTVKTARNMIAEINPELSANCAVFPKI
ncbi:hypothetical protein [Mameliella alba]|uniref:hypothetical protein n=1 Tax=Mameliella alba TaxID=561184 RepID=UPI0010552A46|nr:hypothetical protein [Mameliella alba]